MPAGMSYGLMTVTTSRADGNSSFIEQRITRINTTAITYVRASGNGGSNWSEWNLLNQYGYKQDEVSYSSTVSTSSAGATFMSFNLGEKGLYLIRAIYRASTGIDAYVSFMLNNNSANLYLPPVGGTFFYKSTSDNATIDIKAASSTATNWTHRWYQYIKIA